ncbi:MAG: helix-turn-helix domain-containing protein [Clostridiales bacterium]|nr:helix-turn-helix domain-containing protein [Clostridiales bacterium]
MCGIAPIPGGNVFMNSWFRKFLFDNKKDYHVYIGSGFQGTVAPHHHSFYHVLLLISGSIVQHQNGEDVLQSPGEVFITAPGVTHSLDIAEGTRYYCLSFSRNVADMLLSYFPRLKADFSNFPALMRLSEKTDAAVKQSLACLIEEQTYAEVPYYCTGHLLAVSALMMMLRDVYVELFLTDIRPKQDDFSSMLRCLEYIDAHYDEPVNSDELARMVMLSKSAFYKAFQAYTGRTVKQYLTEKRIREAIQFMSLSNLSLNDIGKKVGYEDFSTFYRNFVKITGMSPTDYRTRIVTMGAEPHDRRG